MTEKKLNIILIGSTGAGKSTAANVIVNKDDEFKPIFKESSGSVSSTKGCQVEEVKMGDITYRIIDTIGIGDTSLSEQETLYKLGSLVQEIKEDGINQIFFVGNGRFTKETIEALRILSLVIFDKNVSNYTTILRTSFSDFRDSEKCDRDIQALRGENPDLTAVIDSVNGRVIHIDAPARRYLLTVLEIKKDWKESNKIIWTHLGAIKDKKYMPENIMKLNARIDEFLSVTEVRRRSIKTQIENLGKEFSEAKSESRKKEIEETIDNLKRELKLLEERAVGGAVKEHEKSLFNDLRENFAAHVGTSMELGERALPYGGAFVGGTVGVITGAAGGIFSSLYFILRGRK